VIVLQQLSGANRGRRVEFSKGSVLLGRSPDAELRFDAHADIDVSARHAVLELDGERWILRDVGSRNGTFVGGKRIRERVLADRDEIELGHGGPRLFVTLPGAESRLEHADTEPGRSLFEVPSPGANSELHPSEEATRVVSHEAETVVVASDAPTVALRPRAERDSNDELATRREKPAPTSRCEDEDEQEDEEEDSTAARLEAALSRTRLALVILGALLVIAVALLLIR
jgi:hypothetical protein